MKTLNDILGVDDIKELFKDRKSILGRDVIDFLNEHSEMFPPLFVVYVQCMKLKEGQDVHENPVFQVKYERIFGQTMYKYDVNIVIQEFNRKRMKSICEMYNKPFTTFCITFSELYPSIYFNGDLKIIKIGKCDAEDK